MKLAPYALLAALAGTPAVAAADTIVSAGGKPGVAESWKTEGDTVVLTIQSDFSASEVAEAIAAGVAGATATAGEGTVTVKGVEAAKLLTALERVEVDVEMDDIDSMFAAIQNPGADDEGSGSSIRATKAADMSEAMKTSRPALTARVSKVRHKRFPLVALTIKVDAPPEGAKSEVGAGDTITIVPRIRTKRGVVDAGDDESQKNLSAWYARPGDKIRFTLVDKKKKFWVATGFGRID